MSEVKLKPCPWCNEEVTMTRSFYPSMVIISCGNVDGCKILPNFSVDVHTRGHLDNETRFIEVEKSMIKAWNTRPTASVPSVEEIEYLIINPETYEAKTSDGLVNAYSWNVQFGQREIAKAIHALLTQGKETTWNPGKT